MGLYKLVRSYQSKYFARISKPYVGVNFYSYLLVIARLDWVCLGVL